jgi:hypothetical protein
LEELRGVNLNSIKEEEDREDELAGKEQQDKHK